MKAKLLASKVRLRTPIFTVTDDLAIDPHGQPIRRFVVRQSGSAVVLPVDEKGRLLLVRQYRLPAGQSLWELPAGRVDPGESRLKAARRELQEETGYRARRWNKLVSFYASPGYAAENMTIFLATDLIAGPQEPADDERIECRWFTRREMDEAIRAGRQADAKTILGYLFWLRGSTRTRA
jgi:ADP-ribose pyrophosphatase